MSAWIRNLLVLLAVQLLLLIFLQFSGAPETNKQASLLALEASSITGLSLSDAEGNETSVALNEGQWQLPSGLPVSADKVTELLDKLTSLSLSWPVSTSAATHERFEVAQDKYQRRVTLTGDSSASLLFGTSPGHQQIHARGDSDDVYAVKLATYEMPAKADDWLDKNLLQASGDITAVNWGSGVSLQKSPGGWLSGGSAASTEGAESAVARLAQLQVLGVLDAAPTAAPTEAKEILVTDGDGDYRLSYWERAPKNDHVVMSTRYPGEAFRVSNYVAEQLTPAAAELMAPKMPEVDLSDALPVDPAL